MGIYIHNRLKEVLPIVNAVYPDANFELPKIKSNYVKRTQELLKTMLKTMFPEKGKNNKKLSILIYSDILEEYQHPDISKKELDLFLPELKLAFEYQVLLFCFFLLYRKGEQHYRALRHQHHSSLIETKKIDSQKRNLTEKMGKKTTCIKYSFYTRNYLN